MLPVVPQFSGLMPVEYINTVLKPRPNSAAVASTHLQIHFTTLLGLEHPGYISRWQYLCME